MRPHAVLLFTLLAFTLAGCAAPENPLETSYRSGFWLGLWHGIICPIALVVSWFNSSVSIYDVHNNGGWYNTGFVLGAGAYGFLGLRPNFEKSIEHADDEDIIQEARDRGLVRRRVRRPIQKDV